MVRKRPNFEMIEVEFARALESPRDFVAEVNDFLGGRLDTEAMMTVVDPKLYRNRKPELLQAQD